MALPTYVGSGAFGNSTGTLTPAWPAQARQANDIALLVVESENQTISLSDAQSFVEVTNSPQGTGSAGAAGSTRIAVYWRRLSGASDTAPTIADAGDHVTGQLHVFRGCKTSGDPWDYTTGAVDAVADFAGDCPGGTTLGADRLLVLLCSSSRNTDSTTSFNAPTNTSLTSITERTDNVSTVGLGGGHQMSTGARLTAGTVGTTTFNIASGATLKGMMTIALAPAATAHLLVAESGSYAATGTTAALLLGHVIAAAAGAYSPSGTAADLEKGSAVIAEAGSYSVTGSEAVLTYTPSGNKLIAANTTAYALTGSSAGTLMGRKVFAETAVFGTVAQFVPDFVVSTSGGTGAGTEADPWSFAYAIDGAGGALTAGKTVGMHGGNYGSSGATHLVTVAGSQGSLITFRNFPGEVVAIQGNVVNGTFGSTTTGAWVRFWGFGLGLIVYESSPSTVTAQNGIATHGRGVEWINVVVHDFGQSGMAPQRGPDGQIYGCITYHNGKALNLDHGFYYMHFDANARKTIKECVAFQNWVQNFQGDGGSEGDPVDLEGNIAFSAAEICSTDPSSRDYFDNRPDAETTYRFNYGWRFADADYPEGVKFQAGTNGILIAEDNVFYGGLRMDRRATQEFRRNKHYAMRRWWWEVPSVPTAAPVWDNTDYGKRSGDAGASWGLICPGGFGGGDDIGFTDLASWKTAHNANTTPNTTPDTNATFFSNTDGVPASGKLIVKRANAYESGRGHIVIYNWDKSSTVDVTLSGIVGVGQPYAIRHFQSLFTTNSSHIASTPLVSSGSYDGGSVTLPMTVAAGLPTPLGPYTRTNVRNPRETGPDFGAFLVLRS